MGRTTRQWKVERAVRRVQKRVGPRRMGKTNAKGNLVLITAKGIVYSRGDVILSILSIVANIGQMNFACDIWFGGGGAINHGSSSTTIIEMASHLETQLGPEVREDIPLLYCVAC